MVFKKNIYIKSHAHGTYLACNKEGSVFSVPNPPQAPQYYGNQRGRPHQPHPRPPENLQLWEKHANPDSTYSFRNKATGRWLSVDQNGRVYSADDCKTFQTFHLGKKENGVRYIQSVAHKTYVTIRNDNTTNATPDAKTWQVFEIKKF